MSSRELLNTKPIEEMPREELIAELYWNGGGDGWGVCAIGNMFAAMAGPPRYLRSPVTIGIDGQPGDGFTDDELRSLVKISRDRGAESIRILGSVLASDNLITIRKSRWDDGKWTWRKRSWECGPLVAENLEDLHQQIMKT